MDGCDGRYDLKWEETNDPADAAPPVARHAAPPQPTGIQMPRGVEEFSALAWRPWIPAESLLESAGSIQRLPTRGWVDVPLASRLFARVPTMNAEIIAWASAFAVHLVLDCRKPFPSTALRDAQCEGGRPRLGRVGRGLRPARHAPPRAITDAVTQPEHDHEAAAKRALPWVPLALIAINVVVFAWSTARGVGFFSAEPDQLVAVGGNLPTCLSSTSRSSPRTLQARANAKGTSDEKIRVRCRSDDS